MINRLTSSIARWPTWIKASLAFFALCVAIGIFGNSEAGRAAKEASAAKEANKPKPAPQSLGERLFTNRLVGYTETDDGRILVAFEAWRIEKESIHDDIRRFMIGLASYRDKAWTSVTISAYGTVTDAYGKDSKVIVYTWTIDRSEASKVIDWNKAKVDVIGEREFAIPKLQ